MDRRENASEKAPGIPEPARAKRLTVAEVLQTPGFEDYSEEQAERYILDVERLCLWMYKQYCLIKCI